MFIKQIMDHGGNRLQLTRECYLDILCNCKINARKKHKKRKCNEKKSFVNEIHCPFVELLK